MALAMVLVPTAWSTCKDTTQTVQCSASRQLPCEDLHLGPWTWARLLGAGGGGGCRCSPAPPPALAPASCSSDSDSDSDSQTALPPATSQTPQYHTALLLQQLTPGAPQATNSRLHSGLTSTGPSQTEGTVQAQAGFPLSTWRGMVSGWGRAPGLSGWGVMSAGRRGCQLLSSHPGSGIPMAPASQAHGRLTKKMPVSAQPGAR
ncbi:uncharacterized protein LOC123632542 [Lemur catta]|uniref:uncharacterized protein LOC123632542 n=1 Tax=Lemur catta TaxID=9447 RepID=UPI001E26745E|nr:uncharacterized protein LOC123632542 [Lemur catta]